MEQTPTGRATNSALGGTLNREARRHGAAVDAKSNRAESLAVLSRQLILPHTARPQSLPRPCSWEHSQAAHCVTLPGSKCIWMQRAECSGSCSHASFPS